MNCLNCHSKNSLLANFCAKCGNPFTEKLANFKKVAAVPNDVNTLNTNVYQKLTATSETFLISVGDKDFVLQKDGTNSQNINLGFTENERIVQKPVLTGTHLFIPTNQRLFSLLISTTETFSEHNFQVTSGILAYENKIFFATKNQLVCLTVEPDRENNWEENGWKFGFVPESKNLTVKKLLPISETQFFAFANDTVFIFNAQNFEIVLQKNYTVEDSLVSVANRLFYLENGTLKRDYFNENNDLISMDFLVGDRIQGIFPVNQNLIGVERLNSVAFYDVYTKNLICEKNTRTLQPAGKSFCADSYLIVFIRDDGNFFVEIYEFATNSFVWKFQTQPTSNILEANLTDKFLHLLCLNQDNFIELKTYSS